MWMTALLVVALAACGTGGRWPPVEGGADLTTHDSWRCYGGVDVVDGALVIGTGDTFRALTNTYGPRLRADGDFGISATLDAQHGGLAALSLVGRLSHGDWWNETQRLDVGLGEEQVVVNFFDGTSFLPAASATFPMDAAAGKVTLTLRRVGEAFVVLLDGEELGRMADPGALPDGTAYVGVSLQPQTTLTLHELVVEAPPGAPDAVSVLLPTDNADYTPTDPPLRELAAARGLYVGAAVSPRPLRCEDAYGQVLGHELNALTTENALKFGPVHPEPERYSFEDADLIVDFAEEHDMLVRGHTLVWHNAVPEWISTAEFTPEVWNDVLHDHIATVVGRYQGRVHVWDVVNEAIGDGGPGDLRDTLWVRGVGPDYIDKAFRWAHEADPDALLFYNDYGAEGMGGKSQQVYDLVAGMLERGVPIHGVGLQMHLTLGEIPDPDQVRANIERLGALGLQVHITEMDLRLPTDPSPRLYERQAEVYRELSTVCLEAENCTAFVMWGFTDRYSWIPQFFPGMGEGLIFDDRYRRKPAYEALREALAPGETGRADPAQYGADCNCAP
jgi:endo-1,4-beta-xylanase